MVKITVLNDDRNDNCDLESEHGFSIHVNVDNKSFLMDVGQSEIFMNNANKLGINLDEVKAILLSHGHYDHGNGLKYFNRHIKLVMHPDCTLNRISKRSGSYGGLNLSLEELNDRFELVVTKDICEVFDGVYFLGEIERSNDYEAKSFPMVDEQGNEDITLDDSGCVIKTVDGIIVISGCAHSGICNTIEYAKKVTGIDKVLAVFGGFHLKVVDEMCRKTIDYLKDNDVKNIYMGHCTSNVVCEEFVNCIGDKVNIIKVGKEYSF